MENITTAEEFLQDHLQISHFYDDKTDRMVCFSDDVQKAMIEFAKLHVEAALKIANEEALRFVDEDEEEDYKPQIIDGYPLDNIK
jgi:hypothetical protein